ncbi:glycoside hydrolase family 3 protein [Arthrobacter sp. HY1533]|uniref:glycoside hydrolase family 3 protein n=1 Tax=Arthrobacter sp. HY1533 TaxID=2970919 RepID=UPI0022BA0812|nr:glycoside hydrolase family 3 N-terminal domain-containing protein [Arthrobacter sp. HY1533]
MNNEDPQAQAVDTSFRDASLPVAERVEILLGQMTLEEKAGLFFHTMVVPGGNGTLEPSDSPFKLPGVTEMVVDKAMTHFNVLGSAPSGAELAAWHNAVQELAAGTRLGIPVTLSTDPRHHFSNNPGASILAGPFSQWPETLGFGALDDEALTESFGDIARQEYAAVGLRVALHPQIDLATEPRWGRQNGTFGENAELTARLGAAYIRGFQGETLGPDSVSTMTKHFPGGGPQLDGEDPHFAHGREQVYPGDNFEYHLKPFEAAFEAGTSQLMPYYGMPVGTGHEEVGFGFNKSVITGLARERYGFDGIVCTDWGLLSDAQIMGEPFPARAWGVEHLSVAERMAKVIEAGVDQFGGEAIPEVLVQLVQDGTIAEARLDESARRLLREKFILGLFDAPFVDVEAAARIVGSPECRAAGERAQREALTVLANGGDGGPTLPLARGIRIYAEGLDPATAAGYGTIVDSPAEADVALLRLSAPFEPRPGVFESFFHQGSLAFPQEEIERINAVCAAVPTVLEIYLDRPAILTPFAGTAAALVVDFGASDHAVLDVLFGDSPARGRLPFELPSSMAAVAESRSDMPSDTADALFPFGHGITL